MPFIEYKIFSGKSIAYIAYIDNYCIELIGSSEQIYIVSNRTLNLTIRITDRLNIMQFSVKDIENIKQYLPDFNIEEIVSIEQVNITFDSGSKLIYRNITEPPNVLENML